MNSFNQAQHDATNDTLANVTDLGKNSHKSR